MVAISSRWATSIRAARIFTAERAARVCAQAAITIACAWWRIIPCMKRTSARV
jgi:hypothetical protein